MGKGLCFLLMIVVLSGAVTVYAENRNEPGKPENTVDVAKAESKICPYCGEENLPDAVWCWKCGKKLPQEKAGLIYCPYCGARISSTAKYCPECGRAVSKGQSERTERHGRTGPRGRRPRGLSGLSFSGGAVSAESKISGAARVGGSFYLSDYFTLGPAIEVLFNSDGTGLYGLASARIYFIPYTHPIVKPYFQFEAGVGSATVYVQEGPFFWNTRKTTAFSYTAGGSIGMDFDIPNAVVTPYFDVGGLVAVASYHGATDSAFGGSANLGCRLYLW